MFYILLAFFMLPSFAQAHVIGGSGLINGLLHPLTGLDHLMAMIAVGIIGSKYRSASIFLLPATFLISMCVGLCSGFISIFPPLVEIGICCSLLYFGAIIYSIKDSSLLWTIGGVAFFAYFHGHSHGEEFFLILHHATYYLGLTLSTAILHIFGVAVGVFGKDLFVLKTAIRFSGIMMLLMGVYSLIANLRFVF